MFALNVAKGFLDLIMNQRLIHGGELFMMPTTTRMSVIIMDRIVVISITSITLRVYVIIT